MIRDNLHAYQPNTFVTCSTSYIFNLVMKDFFKKGALLIVVAMTKGGSCVCTVSMKSDLSKLSRQCHTKEYRVLGLGFIPYSTRLCACICLPYCPYCLFYLYVTPLSLSHHQTSLHHRLLFLPLCLIKLNCWQSPAVH